MKISLLEILTFIAFWFWLIFVILCLNKWSLGLTIVIVEFNHVITYEHENICFKLVFNLISNLLHFANLMNCLFSGKATINFKSVPMTLSFSPFIWYCFSNSVLLSKSAETLLWKRWKMKDCCLKLEMVEKFEWLKRFGFKNLKWFESGWSENVFAFQNNITFQFDKVICYSDLLNCALFIL